jgi:hypothetical protein
MYAFEKPMKSASGLRYEQVFTVYDYHDGPRSGVADFHEIPHFYECVFDEKRDDYSEEYVLIPIRPDIFKLAMENWEIFLRWRRAFDSGQVTLSEHPALDCDKDRYVQTRQTIDQALAAGRREATSAKGEFGVVEKSDRPRDVLTRWQVRWSEASV